LGNVVLFHQGVVAVEGDGVEVEIEGGTPGQLQAGYGVEPGAEHFGVTGRVDPAAVFGQEGAFGDDVEPGEQGQPLVEDRTHDMGVAGGAEQLEGQQGAQGAAGRNHVRAGEARL